MCEPGPYGLGHGVVGRVLQQTRRGQPLPHVQQFLPPGGHLALVPQPLPRRGGAGDVGGGPVQVGAAADAGDGQREDGGEHVVAAQIGEVGLDRPCLQGQFVLGAPAQCEVLAQRAGEDERGVQFLALGVLDDALDAGERGERGLLGGGALAPGRQVVLVGDGPARTVGVHPQPRHLLHGAVDDGGRDRRPQGAGEHGDGVEDGLVGRPYSAHVQQVTVDHRRPVLGHVGVEADQRRGTERGQVPLVTGGQRVGHPLRLRVVRRRGSAWRRPARS